MQSDAAYIAGGDYYPEYQHLNRSHVESGKGVRNPIGRFLQKKVPDTLSSTPFLPDLFFLVAQRRLVPR